MIWKRDPFFSARTVNLRGRGLEGRKLEEGKGTNGQYSSGRGRDFGVLEGGFFEREQIKCMYFPVLCCEMRSLLGGSWAAAIARVCSRNSLRDEKVVPTGWYPLLGCGCGSSSAPVLALWSECETWLAGESQEGDQFKRL